MRRKSRKHALPAALIDGAALPGFEDIRFWGDAFSPQFEAFLERKNRQICAAADAGIAPENREQARCLAISGGGDKGAFAAGLLSGWSEIGTRPRFEIVTGVSAGALAAPFAYLGPSEDHSLREIYTQYGAGELYKRRGIRGFFMDALNDTSRLDRLIRRYVTEEFLDRIAAEHAKGRRLLVMTTNLDAQRKVVWSLSGIAACDASDRRDLFVNVLRASSALPGLFPPVRIEVQATDGRTYEELHVDGGVAAELVFVPPEARIQEIEDRFFPTVRDRCLYVIENGRLVPEYDATELKLLPLTLRAIATMVKFQIVDNLLALSVIAAEHRQGFRFNAIPESFTAVPKAAFDPAYAGKLFEIGLEVGRADEWAARPPVTPALACAPTSSAPSLPAGLAVVRNDQPDRAHSFNQRGTEMTESGLITHSTEPLNAETSLARLRANRITAQRDFYVRSHGSIPAVDVETFVLVVDGLVERPLRLTLQEIRGFDERNIEAVMQCAGNRRADMLRVRPVAGDPWDAGAIGNARWTGVALADVLDAAGADLDAGRHVAFHALDDCEVDGERFRYAASIPMIKALSRDVLLAFAMNDEPLAPEHGFPLRVVVPGYAGVRSPKWLCRVEVRASPSECPIQATDYKLLPPDIQDVAEIDWNRGVTINELPVNSAICEPAAHAELTPGPRTLRGWAMANGRDVARVDVSTDAGRTWRQAKIEGESSQWTWAFWSLDVDLPVGEHELAVRAWDSAGQTQPSLVDDTWNVKGYLSASWHRLSVKVR